MTSALTGGPRLVAIMGSGETTPTMAKLHRELFDRLGRGPVRAVLMDTPYGFQLNAADISARAISYFKESVGRPIGRPVELASLPRSEGASPLALEASLVRVAEARWVFSGPGSPTYALRQWRPTVVPKLLAEKLAIGGCLVFSSAAALTLGHWTVPVYEIYKAGAEPGWVEGLDLFGPYGLHVAVVPHYDNAEGGTHDTRYCYLGEPRLSAMEEQLPDEGWVLGVDEHTACVFDLDEGTVRTSGLGVVTVRRRGRSVTVSAGETLAIEELVGLAFGSGPGLGAPAGVGPAGVGPAGVGPAGDRREGVGPAGLLEGGGAGAPLGAKLPRLKSPLLVDVARLSEDFDRAIARGDAAAATEAALQLEASLHAWSADTFQSDELDRARAALRGMVLRLGQAATSGLADPRQKAAPWVEALLLERSEARLGRRYADADRIRDNLVAAGVEVRDTPAGTEWDLRESARWTPA